MGSDDPDLRTKQGVNEDFVAHTSIPVIPRFTLKQNGRKIFWTLVLLLSVSVFSWQFYLMLGTFLSYPISVNIEMGFQELNFPAVTICNHNRFRASQIHLAGQQFVAFIKGVEEDAADQISGKSNKDQNKTKDNELKRPKREAEVSFEISSTHTATTNGVVTKNETVVVRESSSSKEKREIGDLDLDLGDIKKSRRRPTTKAPEPTEPIPPKPEKPKAMVETGEPEWKPEETEMDAETPVKLSKAAAAVGKYYKPTVNITEKPWYKPAPDAKVKTEEQMSIIMSKIPVSVKSAMGHSITDFIQEVVWNGQKVSPEVFKVFQSNMYGNCYTFNAADLDPNQIKKSRKPGADFGLKITLMLEQDEYMSGAFSPTAGARIVLHEPASPAFPEDRGLDVHPGTLTSVSVKFVEFNRQKKPYGNCSDGDNSPFPGRPILYDLKRYSLQACERSCRQYYNLDLCGCVEPGIPAPENSTLCTVDNITCIEDVRKQYNNGELKCNCDPPCSEQRYLTSQSSSMWPSKGYVDALKSEFATRGGRVKEILEKDAMGLAQNLLKVNIFYEDLNFERYHEKPSYEIENLLGDLGGQLGLWLGLTVISAWEIAEYFGLLLLCLCRGGGGGGGKTEDKTKKYRTNGDAGEDGATSAF